METFKQPRQESVKRSRNLGKAALALVIAASAALTLNGKNDTPTNIESTRVESVIPKDKLIGIIEGLQKNGDSVQVTAEEVALHGPIGDTFGRPIVVKDSSDRTVFLYKQGTELDFNEDASQLADELAVVPVEGDVETVEALISKGNDLTAGIGTKDETVVGYSLPEVSLKG